MKLDDLLTTSETCELLGVTRQTLYAWIEQGKVKPWRKLGGRSAWFFLRREISRNKVQKYVRTNGSRS